MTTVLGTHISRDLFVHGGELGVFENIMYGIEVFLSEQVMKINTVFEQGILSQHSENLRAPTTVNLSWTLPGRCCGLP